MDDDTLVGRSVSMDVSTGDHDAFHRLYGEVVEVETDGQLLCVMVEDNKDYTIPNIEHAAKVLATLFDYPWEYMPEQGRENMRKNVEAVIAAAYKGELK